MKTKKKINIYLGENFINNSLDSVDVKKEMSTNYKTIYLMRAFMAGFLLAFMYIAYTTVVIAFPEELRYVGKLLGSILFGFTLVFIYYSKSELLTSNMMLFTVGKYFKKANLIDIIKILFLCYFGNILGGIFLGFILQNTTIITPEISNYFQELINHKIEYIQKREFYDLLIKAVFANFFINLSMLNIYSGHINSDGLKSTLMIVAVFIFAFLGLEHSVANTVLFFMSIFNNNINFDFMQAALNLIIVLFGNYIGGGLLIGLYYSFLNDNKKSK